MTQNLIQHRFKRVETKFILSKSLLSDFLTALDQHVVADAYANSTITNIYFDNPQFQMIEDSLARKHGKEKVRMRLYDPKPSASSQAFLEIKKKVDGIGYKHRLVASPLTVNRYVTTGLAAGEVVDQEVTDQLQVLRERYGSLMPKMHIAYNRQSFQGRLDRQVRLTIDQDLVYRAQEVSDQPSPLDRPLLDQDQVIMEIKVADSYPQWLADLLERYDLQEASFSKYGQAYRRYQAQVAEEVGHARRLG